MIVIVKKQPLARQQERRINKLSNHPFIRWKKNIKDVDACMTRLRVTVADRGRVGSEDAWKRAGAMGLIVKDNGVKAVYGPKADVLKSDIEDLLQSGADIPEPQIKEVVMEKETATAIRNRKRIVRSSQRRSGCFSSGQ